MLNQLKITECQLVKTYCKYIYIYLQVYIYTCILINILAYMQVYIYIYSVFEVLIVYFSVLLTAKFNNKH